MIPPWVRTYLGIPFLAHGRSMDGCDCWGLVTLIHRDVLGIDLPDYHECYRGMGDLKRRAAGFMDHRQDDFVEVQKPLPGDCVLLLMRRLPVHVGIYAGVSNGADNMIHTEEQRGAAHLEKLYSKLFPSANPTFHRHRSHAAARLGDPLAVSRSPS